MKGSEYTKLIPNRFIAVNKETHKKIHELYKSGWENTIKPDEPYYDVLKKMDTLNDDIERVLYENRINYRYADEKSKEYNYKLSKIFQVQTNEKHYIVWKKEDSPIEYPQDTEEWVKYVYGLNKHNVKNDIQYRNHILQNILELRHLCLYSSWKNFRYNKIYNPQTKIDCKKELETTTRLLIKCFGDQYE